MSIQAMWVPGYVARPEIPGGDTIGSPAPLLNVSGIGSTDLVGVPRGWGITFRGKANHQEWFHFAIPTPVFRDDSNLPPRAGCDSQHARLVRVFVFFRLFELSARLRAVHVWDGPRRLAPIFDPLNVAGDRSTAVDYGASDPVMNANTWPFPDEPCLSWGLGISALIDFGQRDGDVLFTAAGADFRV